MNDIDNNFKVNYAINAKLHNISQENSGVNLKYYA